MCYWFSLTWPSLQSEQPQFSLKSFLIDVVSHPSNHLQSTSPKRLQSFELVVSFFSVYLFSIIFSLVNLIIRIFNGLNIPCTLSFCSMEHIWGFTFLEMRSWQLQRRVSRSMKFSCLRYSVLRQRHPAIDICHTDELTYAMNTRGNKIIQFNC